jgi:hypothetical protein
VSEVIVQNVFTSGLSLMYSKSELIMVEGKTFLETFSLHSCAQNVPPLTFFYGVISRRKIFFCHFDKLGTVKQNKWIAVVGVPHNTLKISCKKHGWSTYWISVGFQKTFFSYSYMWSDFRFIYVAYFTISLKWLDQPVLTCSHCFTAHWWQSSETNLSKLSNCCSWYIAVK